MAATRIAGLKIVPRAHYKLKRIYGKILRLTDKLPKESAYRIYTEQIICYRQSVLNKTEDTKEIEESICCGRIEMLLRQAEDEYELCQKMLIWKPWEPLVECPPPKQWKWPLVCD